MHKKFKNSLFTGGYKPERHRDISDPSNSFAGTFLDAVKAQELISSAIRRDRRSWPGALDRPKARYVGQVMLGEGKVTNNGVRLDAHKNSGIFPAEDALLQRFAIEYTRAFNMIDLAAAWNFSGSVELIEAFPPPNICQLNDLLPFYSLIGTFTGKAPEPWTLALEKKRVLVIHPFEKSIQSQYARRESIQTISAILPEFELITFSPPVTFLNADLTGKKDFFSELDRTKAAIRDIDFDVAIVSGGGTGFRWGRSSRIWESPQCISPGQGSFCSGSPAHGGKATRILPR